MLISGRGCIFRGMYIHNAIGPLTDGKLEYNAGITTKFQV